MRRLGRWLPLCAAWAGALAVAAVAAGLGRAGGAGEAVRVGAVVDPGWIAPPAAARDARAPGRAVVLVVPGLSVEDLLGWQRQGAVPLRGAAVALVSLVPGSGSQPWSAYATLAAGTPVPADAQAGLAFDVDEPVPGRRGARAGQLYRALTGHPPGEARVVHLGVAAAARRSRERGLPVRFGLLADALASRGLRTAAFGNADAAGRPARAATLLAADRYGRVHLGRAGRAVLLPEPSLPAGVATDWSAIAAAVSRLPDDVALVVVEEGDLVRLEADRSLLSEGRYAALRGRVLQRMAAGIASVIGQVVPSGGLVMLVAPAPGSGLPRGQGLGVAALWAPSFVGLPGERGEPRLLASASTRRAGLITLADVVPTLLAWFGLPLPWEVTGRPAGAVAAPAGALAELRLIEGQVMANHARRVALIKGYVLAEIGVLALAALSLRRPSWRRLLRPLLLASVLVPPAYLVLPAVPGQGWWPAAAVLALVAAAAARLSRAPLAPYLRYAVAALASVAAVVADAAAGGLLVGRSPLGYSWIGGVRFYGVGNEYEGVLLGAGAVAAGGAVEAAGLRGGAAAVGLAVPLLSLAAALGSPHLGADFGGALAAGAAVTVAVTSATGRPCRRALWALAAVGAVVAGAAAVAADQVAGAAATHVGQAYARVMAEGWPALVDMVLRKVELNLKLIRYTIWSRVLIALLCVLALLVFEPPGALRAVAERLPALHAALRGAVTGGLVALLVNDSGVVAAATALVYAAALAIDLAVVEAEHPPTTR